MVEATATDGTGTSTFSAAFAADCTGPICLSGFAEVIYNTTSSPFNHCSVIIHQLGDGSASGAVSGILDCTTAHGGFFAGSFNQATKTLTTTVQFSSPGIVITSVGTFTSDGKKGLGTWDCSPTCGGPFTWSSERVQSVSAAHITTGAGGVVMTSLGDSLSIPAGSVATDTNIQLEVLPIPASEPPPPGVFVLSRAFRATPSGTTFSPPATATIHYTVGDIAGGLNPANLRVLVYDNSLARWVYVGGTVDTINMTITFPVSHFTDYGVFDCGSTDFDADGMSDPCDPDDDNDFCPDKAELGSDHTQGGQRNPLDPWDFYDVNKSGNIDLQDTVKVLQHFGHGYNGGAYVDSDDNSLDRLIGNIAIPWLTKEADNGIDLADALANLKSFGDGCP
jgi:hypothetical protein